MRHLVNASISSFCSISILAALSVACGTGPPQRGTGAPAAQWPIAIEPVPLPAVGHTDSPHLTASSGGIILSWIEHRGGTAYLRFAERTPVGWSETRTVASGGNWFLSWVDVPSVIRLTSGALVANWYRATDPAAEAYDIRLSYSTDAGRTWATPFGPHSDRTVTQHGFVSMVAMPDGSLGLIWLDGRDQATDNGIPASGAMNLYYGHFGADWTQTAEQPIDARVCECCPTAAVATADGLLTAFRDRSPREIRDINVSRLDGSTWTPARPIHVDNWRIDACPVNGPALSARGRDVAAAWFTGKDDKPHVFAAFSGDAGRSWSDPIRVDDTSTLGHVDVELLEDGSAAVAWMEFAAQRSSFRLRRLERSGGRSAAMEVTPSRVTGYPRMVRSGKELLLAWTESGDDDQNPEQIKGARVKLP
jgi:hypothetical protein